MLLFIGYEQWCDIFVLGDHFSAIGRGRKFYVVFLFSVGSYYVVLCCLVLVCGRRSLLPVCAYIFVWNSQSLFAKGECTWPQGFGFHLRGDYCFVMLYPYCVHWCFTCCAWVWFQFGDNLHSDAHRAEVGGFLPLCHCGIFDTVFLCAECCGYLIGYIEDPTVLWKRVVFSVKSYTPFLKDACVFVLPFGSRGVLTV